MEEEVAYVCESCGEEIVIPVDFTQGNSQDFVEDCPICCRPNRIRLEFRDDGTIEVWSETEQFD